MASDILHIKDSYYFDVPKTFWKRDFNGTAEIAESFPWFVRLDDDYQSWEADSLITALSDIVTDKAVLTNLKSNWEHAKHAGHADHSRPLDQYLLNAADAIAVKAAKWATRNQEDAAGARDVVTAYLAKNPTEEYGWVAQLLRDPEKRKKFDELRAKADAPETIAAYMDLPRSQWAQDKLAAYSDSLSGKVFIPQVFGGQLRNAYEAQSGFCISKYMIIELVVAILVFATFRWLAGKVSTGASPKGRLWNLLEGSVQFVRNQVVVPAMGDHDADRFMPLLWTMFFFILGCNLMGMLPFIGSPTAAFSTNLVLAGLILLTGIVYGIKELGPIGFFANQAPHIDLPFGIGKVFSFLVWIIEMASMLIKHGVLAVRLLANMVAGHLVLLAIMGIAFGTHAISMHTGTWSVVALVSILGTTALSFLELFVCFLQAYVFTFLAALFIGSAIHHHGDHH